MTLESLEEAFYHPSPEVRDAANEVLRCLEEFGNAKSKAEISACRYALSVAIASLEIALQEF
jgi:hypothetical protein